MSALDDQEVLWQVSPSGEFIGRAPSLGEALERVAELQGQVDDLERDLRGKRLRIRGLESQLVDLRANYDRQDELKSIFDEWREVCGHKRARLSPDRFDAIRGLLEVTRPEPYPREAFTAAIAGAAYDPFITRRRNGTQERHDDIALICKSGKHFEGFIRRARATDQGETR